MFVEDPCKDGKDVRSEHSQTASVDNHMIGHFSLLLERHLRRLATPQLTLQPASTSSHPLLSHSARRIHKYDRVTLTVQPCLKQQRRIDYQRAWLFSTSHSFCPVKLLFPLSLDDRMNDPLKDSSRLRASKHQLRQPTPIDHPVGIQDSPPERSCQLLLHRGSAHNLSNLFIRVIHQTASPSKDPANRALPGPDSSGQTNGQ